MMTITVPRLPQDSLVSVEKEVAALKSSSSPPLRLLPGLEPDGKVKARWQLEDGTNCLFSFQRLD